jgi:micrococcal nuclease
MHRSLGLRFEPALAVLGAIVLAALVARLMLPDSSLAIAAGIFGSGPPRGAERSNVIAVIDGDTLVVEGGRHVRVLGIDTPETVHPDLDGPQAFGVEASARLRDLVDGRSVALQKDATDSDHFGRSLRHVWVGRRLVAETLVREGLGYVLIIPPNMLHSERLRRAERTARDAGRGLWSLPQPESPDIFGTPWAALMHPEGGWP